MEGFQKIANRKLHPRLKMWWAIVLTALVTGCLTILFLNLRAGEKQIRYELSHRFSVEDPLFLRCMGQLLGPGILSGNRLKAFQNGDQIFPAMLDAIYGARNSITFETYIYWSGDIGRKFSEAFCDRSRAGVKVHVLLDWVGTGKIEGRGQSQHLRRRLCRGTSEGVRRGQEQVALDDANGI